MKKTDEKFTTIRVPLRVKRQAERLREELQHKEEFKWVGKVALGFIIGYALAKIIEENEE